MDDIDSKILIICRDKEKIGRIRKMLAQKDNFEFDEAENGWKVRSTSSTRQYLITRNGLLCNCEFFQRWIPYKEGMKRHGNRRRECIHVLALRVYLLITRVI